VIVDWRFTADNAAAASSCDDFIDPLPRLGVSLAFLFREQVYASVIRPVGARACSGGR
jgi:hypothetical protein